MIRNLDIDLQYQPLIDGPPPHHGDPMQKACSGDKPTIDRWRDIWLKQAKENKARFGSFGDYTVGKLYGVSKQKPAIICGSGPSLKTSIPALKENAASEDPLLVVSCLHNFGYFEDEGFHADYYLTLDAGSIVIDDVSEGRQHPPEYYWEKTKGKKLLAITTTDPRVFDKWQGEIYFFNTMLPEPKLFKEMQEIEKFAHYASCGGNALGGVFYITKAIFCADPIYFVGADFCFSHDNQFHSYKTHYDTPGQYVRWPDVFGLPRKTWGSYLNFKFYFDWVVTNVPGNFVSCSEGLLGSYPEGNLRQLKYMPLEEALKPYRRMEWVTRQAIDFETGQVVQSEKLYFKDLYSNPKFDLDLVMF